MSGSRFARRPPCGGWSGRGPRGHGGCDRSSHAAFCSWNSGWMAQPRSTETDAKLAAVRSHLRAGRVALLQETHWQPA
eukprot:13033040-Alexandrium_andersonii.AAC.1